MEFVTFNINKQKNDANVLSLDFNVGYNRDLMIRGKSFYAVYNRNTNLWDLDENNVARLIDSYAYEKVNETPNTYYKPMSSFNSGHWSKWKNYISKSPDSWNQLNTSVIFKSQKTVLNDYASFKLDYDLDTTKEPTAYNSLMSTLYHPEELEKLEWAVGSVFSGESKRIQKFLVLYGAPGSGKSTYLNLITKLLGKYASNFSIERIVSNDDFGLESLKNNPLVAIDHDAELHKIKKNNILNTIVSHEPTVVNEKNKPHYTTIFNSLIFAATNKPVMITDNDSGVLRRLLDVTPTFNKVSMKEYLELTESMYSELGAIAYKCMNTYRRLGISYYDNYRPQNMMRRTNIIFNFLIDNVDIFSKDAAFTMRSMYKMYTEYCKEIGDPYPLSRIAFSTDIKTYFNEWYEDSTRHGVRYKNFCTGLKTDKLTTTVLEPTEPIITNTGWLTLDSCESTFDITYPECFAQYASESEAPMYKWENVTTKLKDISTEKLHYVTGFESNHIVIDLDIRDDAGNKSLELNIKEANKWPKTYTEVSKSGGGLHLHYIWTGGDVSSIKPLQGTGIEVKIFTGKQSLRRKLSLCFNTSISELSTGLVFKDSKMITNKTISDDRHLHNFVESCLRKSHHGHTYPELCFICSKLDEMNETGIPYDISDLRMAILNFAGGSTNQKDKCLSLVSAIKWVNEAVEDKTVIKDSEAPITFFDIEVFPNLLLVCYKERGDPKVIRLYNPTADEIELLCQKRLVGFNNKKYDNHILYARMLGYDNARIHELSSNIVKGVSGFVAAHNVSYSDVYDFATKKQSLKKWELDFGMKHLEFEYGFDKELPEDLWSVVGDYCEHDVICTEKVFDKLSADWSARCVLAELSGGTVNHSTGSLVTKLIFGDDKNPKLVYTDLSKEFPGYEYVLGDDNKMHNMYKGVDVGFGGYVIGVSGYYENVPLLDIESMHPSSLIALNYFGEYTQKYAELKAARVAVKSDDIESLRTLLGGALIPYVEKLKAADNLDALSNALKLALNSTYGYTSAKFDNAMKHPDNTNNIIALRGALFMIDLKEEVEKRGFQIVNIKTDSIKIANGTQDIIDFCMEFAARYGYKFKHEATYEKLFIANKAVNIGYYSWAEKTKDIYKWHAVGEQFAIPYVFKTLFSKEEIEPEDYKITKSVTSPRSIFIVYTDGTEKFVGKVGDFVPVTVGGGELMSKKDDTYNHVTGTKGYFWKEYSKNVDITIVDFSYFSKLLDDAKTAINNVVDINYFIGDNSYETAS